MPNHSPLGATRRTIQCSCGHNIRGHYAQLEGVIKTHMKVCAEARVEPDMLARHRALPFNEAGNGYIQDRQRGEITTAFGSENGTNVFGELTQVAGSGDNYSNVSKKDLEAKIRASGKTKKPPTGKEKREAKKSGGGSKDTNYFVVPRSEMIGIADLGDELVADGYEPSYQGFWKGSVTPITTKDKELFDIIRRAGKDLAEKCSVEELRETLDSLEHKIYHTGILEGLLNGTEYNGADLPPQLLLYHTLYATNIYAFSWKTGICGENEGFGAYFIKPSCSKYPVVFLKEFF